MKRNPLWPIVTSCVSSRSPSTTADGLDARSCGEALDLGTSGRVRADVRRLPVHDERHGRVRHVVRKAPADDADGDAASRQVGASAAARPTSVEDRASAPPRARASTRTTARQEHSRTNRSRAITTSLHIALQNRASESMGVSHDGTCRPRSRLWRLLLGRIRLRDLDRTVERLHQLQGACAQSSADLREVLIAHLPHGAIELELLDRSEHERLLLFQKLARPAGRWLRGGLASQGIPRSPSAVPHRRARPRRSTRSAAISAAGCVLRRHDDRPRRSSERQQDVEVPGLKAGIAARRAAVSRAPGAHHRDDPGGLMTP